MYSRGAVNNVYCFKKKERKKKNNTNTYCWFSRDVIEFYREVS